MQLDGAVIFQELACRNHLSFNSRITILYWPVNRLLGQFEHFNEKRDPALRKVRKLWEIFGWLDEAQPRHQRKKRGENNENQQFEEVRSFTAVPILAIRFCFKSSVSPLLHSSYRTVKLEMEMEKTMKKFFSRS